MKNNNSHLIELLKVKPIAFNPILARITSSVVAGLFLCQLLYWDGRGEDGLWVYKTIKDMENETGLTRSEQDRAIRILKKMGIIEIKVSGIPAKRFFHIYGDDLVKIINKYIGKELLKNE